MYMGAIVSLLFGGLSICTASKTVHLVTIFFYTAGCLGISLLGAPRPRLFSLARSTFVSILTFPFFSTGINILCHRYLLERASIMDKMCVFFL